MGAPSTSDARKIGSMNKIERLKAGQVGQWEPEKTKRREVEAEAIKKLAREIEDWELLDDAVEQQIENQRKFVEWWREKVTRIKGGDRKSKNQIPRSADLIPMRVAETNTGISNQKVARWDDRLEDIDAYRIALRGPSYRVAMADIAKEKNIRGTAGTGEFERYTPAEYIEMARTVLGEIDTDPASCKVAQKVVKATEFFTAKDDGLAREWHGRVWLNPPYHRDLAPAFIDKLVTELDAGRVTAAIMLTNNSTDTDWFEAAQRSCQAICFTHGRICFSMPSPAAGVSTPIVMGTPTQGQAFFYFGDDVDRFCEVFCKVGFIATGFVAYETGAV